MEISGEGRQEDNNKEKFNSRYDHLSAIQWAWVTCQARGGSGPQMGHWGPIEKRKGPGDEHSTNGARKGPGGDLKGN